VERAVGRDGDGLGNVTHVGDRDDAGLVVASDVCAQRSRRHCGDGDQDCGE
jgi:hypothetical protein